MQVSELYLCSSHLFLISDPHLLPVTSSSLEDTLLAVSNLLPWKTSHPRGWRAGRGNVLFQGGNPYSLPLCGLPQLFLQLLIFFFLLYSTHAFSTSKQVALAKYLGKKITFSLLRAGGKMSMNTSPLTLSTSQWVQYSSRWSFIAQVENGTDKDLQRSHHTRIPVFAENVSLEMQTTSCTATFPKRRKSGLKTPGKTIFHTQGITFPFLSLSVHNSVKIISLPSCQLLKFERRFPVPCQILFLSLLHLLFQRFVPNLISWFWLFFQEALKKNTPTSKSKYFFLY